MQLLFRTLQDHDLGHLRILAEFWGFDLPPGPALQAAQALNIWMLDPTLVSEIVESLPLQIRHALDFIVGRGGRVPLPDLIYRFGPLREMGAGRRDREKPWRDHASSVEALWYRGLIARAFMDTPSGPQEFAFIPTDLLSLIPKAESVPELFGLAADPPPHSQPATSASVDDATTLLAAFRRDPGEDSELSLDPKRDLSHFLRQPASIDFLITLLLDEGMLSPITQKPVPKNVGAFLDATRASALRSLILAWVNSTSWNDLEHSPHLSCANDNWPNDPLISRRAVIGFLHHVPLKTWWDVDCFLQSIRDHQPSFQRPAGDFDSWYLRDKRTGIFLRGFEYWDAVEGSLLRFMITGPLHWLGAADLGKIDPGGPVTAFRLTPAASVLFDHHAPLTIKESTASAQIRPEGRIIVPRRAVRALRYQISRFTAWDLIDEENYHYRITPAGLAIATKQGLQLKHIAAILDQAGEGPVPESLRQAIERWGDRGTEARLETKVVLRVRQPEVLIDLQQNPKTARFLGEVLGPTTVTIRPQDWSGLCAASAKMGFLIDPPPSNTT